LKSGFGFAEAMTTSNGRTPRYRPASVSRARHAGRGGDDAAPLSNPRERRLV
jgi:hypothetical protein